MQFNRTADGVMHPLPAPSVDTGMGLERVSAVLQHVHSNYEIDLFQNLLKASAEAIGCANDDAPSLKVVADHIRSCSFLIADGVLPSTKVLGYVLRRIIAAPATTATSWAPGHLLPQDRHGAGRRDGRCLPEAETAGTHRARAEDRGRAVRQDPGQSLKILEQDLAELQNVIPGNVVFKLYDTYGFPVDLTNDIARERELTIDEDGFEREMGASAPASSAFGMDYNSLVKVDSETRSSAIQGVSGAGQIVALFRDGQAVERLEEGGERTSTILDQTPFYAESGGQVGDSGYLEAAGVRFDDARYHQGRRRAPAPRRGRPGQPERRRRGQGRGRRLGTPGHRAQPLRDPPAACRAAPGTGRARTARRARWWTTAPAFRLAAEAIKAEQLKTLEDIVNAEIHVATPSRDRGNRYRHRQRPRAPWRCSARSTATRCVLSMGGDFSVELCGGTRVSRTGDIGLFKITSEGGVAAGVRRIEAVTSAAALAYLNGAEEQLKEAASLVKGSRDNLLDKPGALLERNRSLEKELEQLKAKAASAAGDDLSAAAVEIQGAKVLAARLDGLDGQALLALVNRIEDAARSRGDLLGGELDGKVVLVAGVTQDLTGQLKDRRAYEASRGGSWWQGGGCPDMAQGGGTDAAKWTRPGLAQRCVEQGSDAMPAPRPETMRGQAVNAP